MSSIVLRDPSRLSIRVPRTGFKATGAAFAEATRERGSLVDGGTVSDWAVESIDESGGEVLLSGPAFEGSDLDEAASPEAAAERALAVARALAALSRAGRLPSACLSAAILASPEGRVLFLPPSLASRAFSLADPARRESAIALASPRGGGPEAEASFFLAQLVYRAAVGSPAFEPAGADRKAPLAAEGFVPAALVCPRLEERLASLADKALADPAGVALGEWVAALEAASPAAGGWYRDIPASRAEDASRKKAALEAKLARARARALFWKKRGAFVIGGGVALGVALAVAASILQAAAARPDYSTYDPARIVETYYAALDGLDIESLEACTEKSAREDSTYVINLTVITKTRLAYEGRDPWVRARDWIAAGSPPLSEGAFLYGIAGLTIRGGEPAGEGTADRSSFVADYSLWTMDRSGETAAPQELRRRDALELAKGKKGWKIVGIERQSG